MPAPIYPVILCGGAGTRLWPLSRRNYPKQFVELVGQESLYQNTAGRLVGAGFEAPLIVTASDFRFIVVDQLAAVGIRASDVLVEPEPKNTAAAVCAAALTLHARAPGALMLVAPSDHLMPVADAFRRTVQAAAQGAEAGDLVTFGVCPDRPETGYGWLQLAQPAPGSEPRLQKLKRFIEKPDLCEAKALLASGSYLWNSGLFLFSTTTILEAFATHAPQILADTRAAVEQGEPDLAFTRLAPEPWSRLPQISLDYAVMEKAQNLSVMPYDGAWSDLGDWRSVWLESVSDETGTATVGSATALDCCNTLLHATSEDQHLVGIGLDNMIAVAMPDAVLVAHKDRAQEVKQAVSALKAQSVSQAESFPRDYRPWGWYERLVSSARFQVKRIVVEPGAALSLQSHQHRAEHWIVVEGRAKVTVDERVQLLCENQSVYVPLGAVHRLENPGDLPLTLIEVQTGSYLGEDDIIRYQDNYARPVCAPRQGV